MRAHRPLNTLLCSAALLFCIASAVRAQNAAKSTSENATYTWTYKYTKGMTYRTRNQGNIYINLPTGIGFGMEMKGATKYEVKDVDDNGDITFVYTREFSEMTLSGREIADETPPTTRVTQVMNKLGLIVRRKVERSTGRDFFDLISLLTSSFPLPPGPVKIGESWTFQKGATLSADRKSTLLGKETIGGVQTLAVKVEVTLPARTGAEENKAVRVEYTYNVDPKAGLVRRVIAVVDNLHVEDEEGGMTLSGDMQSLVLQDKAPISTRKTVPVPRRKKR
jgi:hypothetical protein